tara:strand:+ start:5267 stop:5746 length:480 start_codon:yes stop_codon:yes gene_type:complete
MDYGELISDLTLEEIEELRDYCEEFLNSEEEEEEEKKVLYWDIIYETEDPEKMVCKVIKQITEDKTWLVNFWVKAGLTKEESILTSQRQMGHFIREINKTEDCTWWSQDNLLKCIGRSYNSYVPKKFKNTFFIITVYEIIKEEIVRLCREEDFLMPLKL